ncbi:hypothetical protein KY285_024222 [Solanum tuberosum]|nr:hypothetical protein KY289_024557 [Solanum tuberosum]KAH0673210.1 hypothetical protein KY284_024297 [Solanum tuberosum]KAH0676421.1 hypothetical protein KY285_024222 [Solanum tuberosum]
MVTPSTSVFAADNTTHLVQFNLGSQLPIKLMGPSNFVIWKAQVESLMLGHDLYGYLRWNHDSAVQDCSRECFRATISKNSRSMTAYLQEIRNVADELATVGAPTSDDELAVKILSGLGLEYDSISAAIQARDAPILYEDLYNNLLNKELFLQHKEPHQAVSSITAAMAQQSSAHLHLLNHIVQFANYVVVLDTLLMYFFPALITTWKPRHTMLRCLGLLIPERHIM